MNMVILNNEKQLKCWLQLTFKVLYNVDDFHFN